MIPISALSPRCIVAGIKGQKLESSVWSAAWLRKAEVEAARAHNISLYGLMQRAGKAAFDVFRREYPLARHWLILCGSGNNGGDGFEIARLAADSSIRVTVVKVKGSKPLPEEASTAYTALVQRGGVAVHDVHSWEGWTRTDDVDLVVDGLLGTGIGGAPREDYARLIDRVNSLHVPRVAIDIPSGLDAETGIVTGTCIKAEHTVTFIALKPGLLTGHARDYVGKLHYNSLELEDWMLSSERQKQVFCRRITCSHLPMLLPQNKLRCLHKGMNGRLVLVGGDVGMGGAIVMAAEAALRTGAGLVRVLTRSEHAIPLMCRCPEVMTEELTEANLQTALAWATCVAVGPGLGRREWGQRALAQVLAYCQHHPEMRSVWDADALNIMSENEHCHEQNKQQQQHLDDDAKSAGSPLRMKNRIITPHPGEAARLLQCTVEDVERNRFSTAEKLAARYGGVVLLKGPGTVLYAARDSCYAHSSVVENELMSTSCVVADVGNSGMATGGMGDVLTGIIAALLAQQMQPWHAACAGCVIHGTAADLAAAAYGGERGLTATTLFKHIRTCINPSTK